MGLTDGIFKGDMVLHRGSPYVIEVATRLSGGWFSSIQIPASTSIPFVRNAIMQALGEEIPNFGESIRRRRPVAIRYLMANPGDSLKLSSNFKFPSNRFLVEAMLLKEGFVQESKLESHTDRLGFVISRGLTRRHAIWNANRLIKQVKRKVSI
jgi:biotin carboxylase